MAHNLRRSTTIAVAVATAVTAGGASTVLASPSAAAPPVATTAAVAGLSAPDPAREVAVSASAQSVLAGHGVEVDRSSPAATIMATGADPFRPQQWGLDAVKAPAANTATTGTGVTVGVIDTGVAKVTDLSGKVLPGADFIAGSGDGTNDLNGHGTGIASIIAATAGNAYGMAGVAPGVKILPVRVCDATGSCPVDAMAAGIMWAVDHGAQVLNISLGGSGTLALGEAIAYAESKQVVVAASAGNSAEQGNPVMYPAAYDTVLCVAATDSGNKKASFSEYGEQVDIAAPGVGVIQAAPGERWMLASGTSEASPHVAAVAALVKAYEPEANAAGIRGLITAKAQDLGDPGRDDMFGAGLVDAAATLAYAGAGLTSPAPTVTPTPSAATKAPTVTAVAPAVGSTDGGASVSITGSGFTSLDPADPGAVLFGDTPATSFVVESATKITAFAPAGTGQVLVKATNAIGASTGAAKFTYRAPLTADFDDGVPAKVAGGTTFTVTVSGGTAGATAKDFAAEKITARLGANVAPLAWVDETHLKVTAPATTNANSVHLQLFHDGVPGPVSTSAVNYTAAVTAVSPNKVSGAGGTTVVITGAGFSGVDPADPSAVTFGGVNAASFTVNSATKITAVTPPGEDGPAAVAVRTSGGLSGEAPNAKVTYRAALGLVLPEGAAAKANGGTALTLEVTGGTVGGDAKAFAAENVVAMAGKVRLVTAWGGDETHVKITIPAGTTDAIAVSLLHDTFAGEAVSIPYVPVITSMSASSDVVAGGKKVTIKIVGGDLGGATDFRFGDSPATCAKQGTGAATAYSCTVPAASAEGPTWVSFTASTGARSRFTAASAFAYSDLG